MRDVVLFLLILVFSASAASFAPTSESIGAVAKVNSPKKKPEVTFKAEPASESEEKADLKEALDKIEVRCRSLETILQNIEESDARR